MNHKTLFLASLLVIAVGVIGLIFNQNKPDEAPSAITTPVTAEKSVLVALTAKNRLQREPC